MILLTDEKIKSIELDCDGTEILEFGVGNERTTVPVYKATGRWADKEIAKEQLKQALKGVGKESTRLDGTIYLVPDYVEYRKALKEVGLE